MSFIQTYTGLTFDYTKNDNVIRIVDGAHALSNICRFGGHCKQFYSVAEHCVNVCDMLDTPFKPWGLLHDLTEAYLGDIVAPLKHTIGEPYISRETSLMQQIASTYGLLWPMPPEVHEADMRMCATEQMALMLRNYSPYDPYDIEIKCLPPGQAKELYLERFFEFCEQSATYPQIP